MTAPAWTPSADDVANLIARLLPSADGLVTGVLSPTTIPTAQQVEGIVRGLVAELQLDLPSLTTEQQPAARRVVALGAAAQVAESYFPEVSAEYQRRLDDAYERAREKLLAGVRGTADGDPVLMPTGAYPDGPDELVVLGHGIHGPEPWYRRL